MRNLIIIEDYGLTNLGNAELTNTNGGGWWSFVGEYVAGAVVDHFINDADWAAYGAWLQKTGSPGGHK